MKVVDNFYVVSVKKSANSDANEDAVITLATEAEEAWRRIRSYPTQRLTRTSAIGKSRRSLPVTTRLQLSA